MRAAIHRTPCPCRKPMSATRAAVLTAAASSPLISTAIDRMDNVQASRIISPGGKNVLVPNFRHWR